MQESQWVGLLCVAAGAFSITASACNWDFFMNSRKARAWVKRIGRNNARLMYGGIGVFICLFGLVMVILAPGGDSATAQSETPTPATNPQTARSVKPERNPQPSIPAVASTPSVTSPGSNTPQSTSNRPDTPPTSVASTDTPPEPAIVTTTPEPASLTETTPMPVTVPDGGIDLLQLIDPNRDQLQGNWTLQEGALVSPKDRPANLQIPVDVPASYQLTAIVEFVDGNELVSLGLVVDGHGVAALLSGPGGNNCGLQRVDGKIARQNETYYQGSALGPGANQIVCTVDDNHVQVDCNGETIIDWTGDPARLSSDAGDKLFVGGWNTSFQVSQLTLVPGQP